jgi:hypothetical protein
VWGPAQFHVTGSSSYAFDSQPQDISYTPPALFGSGNNASASKPTRFYPEETPDGSTEVFHFDGVASAGANFQFFWNGLTMNEVDDYTISITGSQTIVTCVRPPRSGDKLFAFF